MTEKRFTFGYIDGVKILKDNDRLVPDVKALELLNNLAKENEQLKQRISELEKEVNALSDGEADWLIDEML